MIKKILPLILVFLAILFFTVRPKADLAVYFLDIGQGDASLIITPTGQNILIDAAPDNSLLYQVAAHLPWWERTIDYVIITHWHDDHFMGLYELTRKYKVKNILVTTPMPDDINYPKLNTTIVKAGESFVLAPDLSFQVLSAEYTNEDFNDNSLVMRLSYGDIDFLFTGDLTSIGEAKLLKTGWGLDSEILKVGHHGSKYSSSPDFLNKVSPEICIIQSGQDNKFGHPHQDTLDRLTSAGCQIYRNDQSGTVIIKSNGQKYWLEL